MADNYEQSGMYDRYEDQASEWLAQSVDYIRQLYDEKADESIRQYVSDRPGISLMIAGFAGLITGVVLRHR
ncbi:MAG: hypothetical protein AB7U45_00625 [Desulfamplus sp.]